MRVQFARSVSFVAFGICLVAAPRLLGAQAKGSSTCKDGTTSAVVGRGACSGHGGVDSLATAAARKSAKADKAETKAAKASTKKDPDKAKAADAKAKTATAKANKAEDKAASDAVGATAQCKDGTYSHAATTKGACSRHGGIGKVLKP